MSLFAGLDEICRRDVPLSEYTWFGLGGRAKWFLEPTGNDQLRLILQRCERSRLQWRLLGGGSNLLVRDGELDLVVIRLSGAEYEQIRCDGTRVWAGAATPLSRLVRQSIREGLAGLECVAGIPGTVGGAVRNNAGGRFGQISTSVRIVRVMDPGGSITDWPAAELEFGYRSSNLIGAVVLAVQFELQQDDPRDLLQRFREAWLYKKNTQPMGQGNAGCVFKNPAGLSAGALIDQAGLKGWGVDGVRVSQRHANFMVAGDGARSEDVLRLIDIVRKRVYDRFGVFLELELELW
jgi:UDP-N-acetylmuramate dehydrogenase